MTPQLQIIVREFESARQRLHDLAARLPLDRWVVRPSPSRWSVAECVAHLNLSSVAYVPLLRNALEEARRLPPHSGRYRRDFTGWLLWKMMGPPVRVRMKTVASFVPTSSDPPGQLMSTFDRLQVEQIQLATDADGLALNDVRIVSPFDRRVKYNMFSCLSILPRHQHRHLWQAEQVAE